MKRSLTLYFMNFSWMKKGLILFLLTGLPFFLMAGENINLSDTTIHYKDKVIVLTDTGDSFKTSIVNEKGDTVLLKTNEEKQSRVVFDGSSCNIIFSWNKKKFDPHWSGLGFGFIGLQDLEGVDLKQSTSYAFYLNMMEYYIPLDRRHWMLVSGLGIDWSRYHFKGDYGLTEIDGITGFEPAPEGLDYRSSKLLTYYMTVPLLLEYQTKIAKKRDFFISGGIVGYIKCYSKSQVEYKTIDGKVQENKGRDLNILPVNARLMLQMGIEDVSLFGYYSPFSLFKKDKGPEVYPFGIGFMLGF